MTKQIICINVGQAGVQMSNAAWELFCVEHGLDVQGYPRSLIDFENNDCSEGCSTFFHETTSGRYVPRAINVDLEPTVIDEIRTGAYRSLWHPSCLLNGAEDAANNYARGRNSLGRCLLRPVMRQLMRLVRDCPGSRVHGLVLLHSLGGGSGSGLGALILECIERDLPKHTRLSIVIYPAPRLTSAVVEPYNAVLGATAALDLTDLVFLLDNESLYQLCLDKLGMTQPTYSNLNRIVSQLFGSLTVGFRFSATSLDHDLAHLQTNLVPYPRIHFPCCNYAPLTSDACAQHDRLSTSELTHELFEPTNQLLRCDIEMGRYIACCLQYRGLVTPRQINLALHDIKMRKDVHFVDWCPTGFKVGITPMPPGNVYGSLIAATNSNVAMFTNSTAIEQVWGRLLYKFDLLFKRKAFVHWFVSEGMEEGEFTQSRAEMDSIQMDYQSLTDDSMPPPRPPQPATPSSNFTKTQNQEQLPAPLAQLTTYQKTDARLSPATNEDIDFNTSETQTVTENLNNPFRVMAHHLSYGLRLATHPRPTVLV